MKTRMSKSLMLLSVVIGFLYFINIHQDLRIASSMVLVGIALRLIVPAKYHKITIPVIMISSLLVYPMLDNKLYILFTLLSNIIVVTDYVDWSKK